MSLPTPKHVECHSYEALVLPDVVRIVRGGALYDFTRQMHDELGVPVIDALQGAFKYGEFLGDATRRLGWYPSRKWGSEAPPEDEIPDWGLFDQPTPVGPVICAGDARDGSAAAEPAAVKRASG
ncbi:MAG: hypothetical protein QGG17_05645 [Rhodospirillales bacterium]|jgi:hypothetical protein|nr:hypothetical protein [Rhodospirillales bacterium]MDP6805290.1 hypothetical protein [Rhodospirillales bacterium]